MDKKIRKNRFGAFIQIILLFVLPVILLYSGVLPVERRFLILVGVVILMIGVLIKERWSLKNLGIRLDNLKNSLAPYCLFTIAVVAIIIVLAQLMERGVQEAWWLNPHFIYFILPVSIFQEFAYRSFLMPKLKLFSNSPIVVIGVNALLFGLLHIIFPDAALTFFLTFLLGLGFAGLYYRYPNLIAISASHFIINFFAVIFCFASFSTC